ncbi:MAG: glycosyltransferase [Pseudomonadales bacterium]|jgi:cellulose synthase/poly-beta-1,6-N-acetylglucosamine synthase-like glycosyltransferase|nr:glycosyltransferase [Pseudomonadales bacterium]
MNGIGLHSMEESVVENPALTPIFSGATGVKYAMGVALWLVALGFFWRWWFMPGHIVWPLGFILATATLAWLMFLAAYFIGVFWGARRITGPLVLPAGSRVAMVVTKAPSEPFEVVAVTLKAMLAQDVPHDTWLADEAPSEATLAWCRQHGVKVSTRQNVADYHRQTWPRRTRCKEGNLAFFYDHYGYEAYDFVSQLDADHVPEPGYLREILKPFADAKVGYVSAPSICDSNAAHSWSARSRLYTEASMHGSLQAGYNGGLAPVCIGSHYAVRTQALKQIGGLGPELAEDHSTTLMMNAYGWRGVHALDAIAHGDGPNTFADLVTQEFQWSRSLVMVLLQYSPRYVPMLPLRLKLQFLFSQFWYPLSSLCATLMFSMPAIALISGRNFANVTYLEFLVHIAPLSLVVMLLFYRWRATGTFRPHDAKVMSWEAAFFLMVRWPWVLLGSMAAVYDWATGSVVNFRVTPKGASEVDPLPLRVLFPYAALALLSALPVLLVADPGESPGFYIFATINAFMYTLVLVTIIVQHWRENVSKSSKAVYSFGTMSFVVGLLVLLGISGMQRAPDGLQALAVGLENIGPFKTQSRIAGAGMNGKQTITFDPSWFSDVLKSWQMQETERQYEVSGTDETNE